MGGETRLQTVLGAIVLLLTFGRCVENVGKLHTFRRWESEKAGRGCADVEQWKRLPGGESNRAKKRRQRNSDTDTAVQKKHRSRTG